MVRSKIGSILKITLSSFSMFQLDFKICVHCSLNVRKHDIWQVFFFFNLKLLRTCAKPTKKLCAKTLQRTCECAPTVSYHTLNTTQCFFFCVHTNCGMYFNIILYISYIKTVCLLLLVFFCSFKYFISCVYRFNNWLFGCFVNFGGFIFNRREKVYTVKTTNGFNKVRHANRISMNKLIQFHVTGLNCINIVELNENMHSRGYHHHHHQNVFELRCDFHYIIYSH